MYSYENSDDCLAIVQMNSQIQHAQLELLSAHCATHQLRLHYSADDLARFGRRDVLRKAAEAASSLNEFYSAIEKKIAQAAPNPDLQLTSVQIAQAVEYVSSYLREQREHYVPAAQPLSNQHKARMWPYFSPAMLDQVRIVELHGRRVSPPAFYAQARALGFDNLPEVTHMDSLTFLDVLVFNQTLTERSLFHALVHAVQFQVLGLERYTELFVQSFVKTKAHFTVPLEAHAFSLESKFMRPSAEKFSVEHHVLRWVTDGRY
ncbi:MAG: hypothetical protein WB781_04260 [Candidatus Sulfotelmatobacter sp.]